MERLAQYKDVGTFPKFWSIDSPMLGETNSGIVLTIETKAVGDEPVGRYDSIQHGLDRFFE